jgi:hypothetical protein
VFELREQLPNQRGFACAGVADDQKMARFEGTRDAYALTQRHHRRAYEPDAVGTEPPVQLRR